jgi:hypothetical protein
MIEHPIRQILRDEGRSVIWLARQIRYTQAYTSSVISGYWNPSREFRKRCAAVMQRSESDLFYATSGPVRPRPTEREAGEEGAA